MRAGSGGTITSPIPLRIYAYPKKLAAGAACHVASPTRVCNGHPPVSVLFGSCRSRVFSEALPDSLRLPSVSGGAAPYPALLLFSGKKELVKREIPRVHDPNFSAGSDTAYAAAPFEARPERTAGDTDPHSMSSAEVTRQSAFAKLEHCAENLQGNIRQTRQRLSNVLRESDSPPPKFPNFRIASAGPDAYRHRREGVVLLDAAARLRARHHSTPQGGSKNHEHILTGVAARPLLLSPHQHGHNPPPP